MFDLIIANPPYGKSCSLCKPITKKLLNYTKDLIVLTPDNMYKDDELRSKIVDYEAHDPQDMFGIVVGGGKLAVAKLDKSVNNEVDLLELKLSSKEAKLLKAIERYNETRKTFNTVDGTYFVNKWDRSLKDCTKTQEFPIEIRDKLFKDCIDEGILFFKPLFWPSTAPHDLLNSNEGMYNIRGIWKDYFTEKKCGDVLVFRNRQERCNFMSWVYQDYDENWTWRGIKYTKFLPGYIREIIGRLRGAATGPKYFYKYFPHLDWTRKWTDTEVMKELGLPEDFLEE